MFTYFKATIIGLLLKLSGHSHQVDSMIVTFYWVCIAENKNKTINKNATTTKQKCI